MADEGWECVADLASVGGVRVGEDCTVVVLDESEGEEAKRGEGVEGKRGSKEGRV